MKIIGEEDKVIAKLKDLGSTRPDEDWEVTYVTSVLGGWDFIAECSFSKLEDLEKIIECCRNDVELSRLIEATTTLISVKRNYP